MPTDPVITTIEAYDRMAVDYAEFWFDNPVMEPALEEFIGKLNNPDPVVMDVGCGPGRDVAFLGKKGIDVLGIDISQAMIREARKRVPEKIFRLMDMRHITYPSETFDGIWACASLHHLTKIDANIALKEMVRVLRIGGILSVSIKLGSGYEFDKEGRFRQFYNAEEFATILGKNNLDLMWTSSSNSYTERHDGSGGRDWLQVIAKKTSSDIKQGESTTKYNPGCPMCWDSWYKRNVNHIHRQSSILWGDDNVIVFPDISPLIDGHILIITKEHLNNLSECSSFQEKAIEETKLTVISLFKVLYDSSTLFFEHGSIGNKEAGSSISHFHLHCVPSTLALENTVDVFYKGKIEGSWAELRRFHQKNKAYIYIEHSTGSKWIYPVHGVPSQFLRRYFGELVGQKHWLWQDSVKEKQIQDMFNRTLIKLINTIDDRFVVKYSYGGVAK